MIMVATLAMIAMVALTRNSTKILNAYSIEHVRLFVLSHKCNESCERRWHQLGHSNTTFMCEVFAMVAMVDLNR